MVSKNQPASSVKIPRFSSYTYCFYYLSILGNVYGFLLGQYWRAGEINLHSSQCCLGSCHLLNVVSMAILIILLIFSAVSTFVFRSSAVSLYLSCLKALCGKFSCWIWCQHPENYQFLLLFLFLTFLNRNLSVFLG